MPFRPRSQGRHGLRQHLRRDREASIGVQADGCGPAFLEQDDRASRVDPLAVTDLEQGALRGGAPGRRDLDALPSATATGTPDVCQPWAPALITTLRRR